MPMLMPGALPFMSIPQSLRGRLAPATSSCAKRSLRASCLRRFFRGIPLRPPAAELGVEPRAGIIPVASRSCARNAEDPGGLIDGQANEVAELDELGLDRILRGEPGQRLVEGEQVSGGDSAGDGVKIDVI